MDVDVDVDVVVVVVVAGAGTTDAETDAAALEVEFEVEAASGDSPCVHAPDIADPSAAKAITTLGDGRRAQLNCRGA